MPERIEDENTLVIAVKYDFYKEKLNEPQNKLTIKETLDSLLECSLQIKISTAEESGVKFPDKKEEQKEKSAQKPRENASLLEDAMNLMGGKIVENNS